MEQDFNQYFVLQNILVSALDSKTPRRECFINAFVLLIAIFPSEEDVKPDGPFCAFLQEQANSDTGLLLRPFSSYIYQSHFNSQHNTYIDPLLTSSIVYRYTSSCNAAIGNSIKSETYHINIGRAKKSRHYHTIESARANTHARAHTHTQIYI